MNDEQGETRSEGQEADPVAAPATAPGSPVPAIVAVVAVVLAALVGLFLWGMNTDSDSGPDSAAQFEDNQAPPLSGTATTGAQFDIADEQGKWVLVNFFATWCPPCVAEHPELVEFAARNADTATVVSVAFDEPAEVIEAFFDANGGDWPVLADAEGIPLDWGVIKLPESYLVSPDGVVVQKLEGGITAAELEELIAEHSSGGDGG